MFAALALGMNVSSISGQFSKQPLGDCGNGFVPSSTKNQSSRYLLLESLKLQAAVGELLGFLTLRFIPHGSGAVC